MDKNINEVLKYIDLKVSETNKCDWDIVRNICEEAIKREGLTKEQVSEMNSRILKEVRNEMKSEVDTFDELIKAGEAFKKALGISDSEIYDLLKKDNSDNERYCTIKESIEESFNEVKLIREGKLPKKTWKELREELDNE